MHDLKALAAAVRDLATRVDQLEVTLRCHDENRQIAFDVVKIREVVERLEEEYGSQPELNELTARIKSQAKQFRDTMAGVESDILVAKCESQNPA